ncbi:hypothetical protein GGH12_001167 [Coemansia sp. RSA 1822]|nr:hypothetical protein LPJ76_002394 [Coemansia sp. RSA 638]KAJ2125452.1 hypothetical protein IW147_000801 [Coemansia sp. RSA 720]KAJ2537864.1 hypothetical protein GGF49_006203 [Coemansia sp. RSA 1853]KAJ2565925.1 hypothetical protein GGH12_001167 [Coemansia sp. RSA 1822]
MAKLTLANFKLRTASNAADEKTEATRRTANISKVPEFNVNNTTAANNESRTVVYNTEAPGFKAKETTNKQSRDRHMCITLPPYLPKLQTPELINGGIYGNIYERLPNCDDPAGYYYQRDQEIMAERQKWIDTGYCVHVAGNLADELKRCGESVPNFDEPTTF